MSIQVTVTLDDIETMATELVLADQYQAANTLLRTRTDMTLSARHAFLQAADPRPIVYVPYGRGVRAARASY